MNIYVCRNRKTQIINYALNESVALKKKIKPYLILRRKFSYKNGKSK